MGTMKRTLASLLSPLRQCSPVSLGIFITLSVATFFLSALPGTLDVNIWYGWTAQLNRLGPVAGYNADVGYILHPPLGLILIWLSHDVPAHFGVPVYLWPNIGFTGYGVCIWLSLVGCSLLVVRMTGRLWLGVLFQVAFTLNTVVYGYFDVWGIPFLLLAMEATTREKPGTAFSWALLASLVKWQYLLVLPFFFLYVLMACRGTSNDRFQWVRRLFVAITPGLCIVLVFLLFFGKGMMLSFGRGLSSPELSGHALNVSWLITWAMHIVWSESYQALENGLIEVIRTRDTRVLLLVRSLFGAAYAFSLWRLWSRPARADHFLHCMLAGYLAYFVLNKGAHENHLVPAMVIAGYLAWRQPTWRWGALSIAVIGNVNMFAFYNIMGQERREARLVLGMDYSLPLALVASVVLLGIYCALLMGERSRDNGVAPVAS